MLSASQTHAICNVHVCVCVAHYERYSILRSRCKLYKAIHLNGKYMQIEKKEKSLIYITDIKYILRYYLQSQIYLKNAGSSIESPGLTSSDQNANRAYRSGTGSICMYTTANWLQSNSQLARNIPVSSPGLSYTEISHVMPLSFLRATDQSYRQLTEQINTARTKITILYILILIQF
jgi:hypothetical protein